MKHEGGRKREEEKDMGAKKRAGEQRRRVWSVGEGMATRFQPRIPRAKAANGLERHGHGHGHDDADEDGLWRRSTSLQNNKRHIPQQPGEAGKGRRGEREGQKRKKDKGTFWEYCFTFDSGVVLIDEVRLDELDGHGRLADT